MKKARIAVLVSGGGTNLQALIDAQLRGELGGGEIVAVISSKEGAYALERGAKVGIPGYVIPRKQFDSNRAMTVALVEKLKELEEYLYEAMQNAENRELAAIARQYRETLREIEEIESEEDNSDEIAAILSERGEEGKPGAVR